MKRLLAYWTCWMSFCALVVWLSGMELERNFLSAYLFVAACFVGWVNWQRMEGDR